MHVCIGVGSSHYYNIILVASRARSLELRHIATDLSDVEKTVADI